MDWQQILGVATPVILGVGFIWYRAELALKALNEVAEVLTAVTKALEDKNLTKEEITSVRKEALEALAAFKALISKR